MERRNFEDSFKDAFREAESNPSDKVWTNIELELEKESGEKTRRTLFFYKMLAAASIAFALSIVGIGYYVLKTNPEMTNAVAENLVKDAEEQAVNGETGKTVIRENEDTQKQAAELSNESTKSQATSSKDRESRSLSKNGPRVVAGTGFLSENAKENTLRLHQTRAQESKLNDGAGAVGYESTAAFAPGYPERKLPDLFELKQPVIKVPTVETDPVALMLAKLAIEEMKFSDAEENDKKEKAANGEKLWTSVGFAAGGFSSVNHSVAPNASQFNSASFAQTTVPDKEAKAAGIAYSMGVSFGTKVAKRWVVQGGLNYLTQSSDYVANNVVAAGDYRSLQAESINTIGALPMLADAASKIIPTVSYSVNNNVKFFSVPVQAGYLLVNKKVGLQLNAGLSTDLFVQNTITPEGGSLNKSTQGRGSDSPYRSVNFSGLVGTELTYRIGQRYRVALNPGLRYPLNSLYKSDVGIQSTPLTFDVGVRFRYIFQ
ncbi:MAG: hypothetical protein WKF87_12285 [Chryseolinea sp.]